jgi:hypothetical protein
MTKTDLHKSPPPGSVSPLYACSAAAAAADWHQLRGPAPWSNKRGLDNHQIERKKEKGRRGPKVYVF